MQEIIKRRIEFDILKGILIITVVLGHTQVKIPYVDVFWFHMPAFFMITGYLTKKWLEPKELIIAIRNKDISAFKRIGKYLLPYFSYSMVFFLICRPESILKNTVRVIYAGANNTTTYSYHFWYINALFIGTIIMGFRIKMRYKIIMLSLIWIIIHQYDVMKLFPAPMPWSLDEALGAVIFLFIGDYAKNIKSKTYHSFFLIIPFLFILVNYFTKMNYIINMKSMIYNHYLLDLIVPISFTYMLYKLSLLLTHTVFVKTVLAYLGKSCMTIYFTHAILLFVFGKYFSLNIWITISVTIILGGILHFFFNQNKLLKIIFTGYLK